MHFTSPSHWLVLLPLLAVTGAAAQEARPAPPDYRSALQDYQAFADQEQVPWKDANETVRQVGGWRAYAREAAGARPPEAKPADAKPDPHHGHAAPAPGAKP